MWNERDLWRLSRKVQAYRSLEAANGFEIVMADLAKFCHYNRPTTKVSPVTASVDPIAMAQAEGRREVYLRILEMMDTNEAKIRAWIQNEMIREQGASIDDFE